MQQVLYCAFRICQCNGSFYGVTQGSCLSDCCHGNPPISAAGCRLSKVEKSPRRRLLFPSDDTSVCLGHMMMFWLSTVLPRLLTSQPLFQW